MAKVYYDSDANLDLIKNKTIAISGNGSQGHAHALNLQDSGMNVIVGLYEGSRSWEQAEAQGLPVMPVAQAAERADVVMILVPDTTQAGLYEAFPQEHIVCRFLVDGPCGFKQSSLIDEGAAYHRQQGKDAG